MQQEREPENAYRDVFYNGAKSYFPAGQVSNVTSVAGTTTYGLDAADRVSSLSASFVSFAPLVFNYSYNSNNALLSGFTCTNSGLSASYSYDILDRLTSISARSCPPFPISCAS